MEDVLETLNMVLIIDDGVIIYIDMKINRYWMMSFIYVMIIMICTGIK